MATNFGAEVDSILATNWTFTDGVVVPDSDNVALSNGAVRIKATILYADLAESSNLVKSASRADASRVYKAFLACSAKLILANGGRIRSFDGDRVMGVFIGKKPNTDAVETALNINWLVVNILRPKLAARYPTMPPIRHGTGVDRSDLLVVRGGVRANNDLVWIGESANFAAKLSSIREDGYSTYISEGVFKDMLPSSRIYDGSEMWEARLLQGTRIYRSAWWRRP